MADRPDERRCKLCAADNVCYEAGPVLTGEVPAI
jgi:hypothetical protein